MKSIYLTRHAKSSWKFKEKRDIERPLKQRGRLNAEAVAKHLKMLGEQPDYFLSSPAERAKQTAAIFMPAFNKDVDDLELNDSIYESSVSEMFTILLSLPEDVHTVMLFGHEPTFSDFTQMLTGKYIEKFFTSGVAKISFPVQQWNEVSEESGKLDFFIYPAMIKK